MQGESVWMQNLSRPRVTTLHRLSDRLTGCGEYLFPDRNDQHRPTSNGAILAVLRRMGYAGKMTGHGFRSLAMGVIKARLGYRHEVVNRQLAHGSNDEYGEAYDCEQFIAESKTMMQAYADYIDMVHRGGDVVQATFRRH